MQQHSMELVNQQSVGGQGQRLDIPDAEVYYYSQWLSVDQADHYLQRLIQTLEWRQDDITLFGRTHKIPRLQAWYGDKNARYTYSNIDMRPLVWTCELLQLKQKCEDFLNTQFNSVLANYYRDGNDSMGFHADDEDELGPQPVIASISLGQQRNFDLVHKHSRQRARISLQHGSLLAMKGDTQRFWKHGINKSKKITNPRINLTFRYIF